MKSLRILTSLSALAIFVPLSAAAAPDQPTSGAASGTVVQCAGYPVPPFQTLAREGVTLTIGQICHVYAGTVAGVVKGTQYTVILPDTSRLVGGQVQFVGSVAGRQGVADLRFDGTRSCFPGCPATTHAYSVDAMRGLTGLQLDLTVIGLGPFTYTGRYSFSKQDEGEIK
jgi:hypothetical protein